MYVCINDQVEAREGNTEAADDAQMNVRDLCFSVCLSLCVYACMVRVYVCIHDLIEMRETNT